VKTRANEEIYKSLGRAVRTGNVRSAGQFRDLVSDPVLTLEFAPLLNRIISPPIRPVRNFLSILHIDESNTLHNTGQ
jgi:chromosome transmission fidelity protein 18